MMLLKIWHGCHNERLPDGSLTISDRFYYQLPLDPTILTQRDLIKQFKKFKMDVGAPVVEALT